jgi:hypothetical protein
MRSILEKAFVALINEENDKAEELFHKFIVERARQIHESNRAGDDFVLEENWNDEITSESYFTEDDLSDLEDDGGEEAADGDEGGDVAEIGDADSVTDVDAADEFGGEGDLDADLDAGAEGGEGLEDKIDDLTAQIEKLTAEFEAVMDAIGDEGDFGDVDAGDETEASDDAADVGADDDFGADASEEDAEAVEDDMDGAEEPAMEGEEGDDEFDDITESIIDELEKVTVNLSDGKEVGEGKGFTQNKGASIPQKNKDARQGGAPIKMKQDAHKGYEREAAPGVETLKPRRNNVPKANAALSKVSKEGDKSAEVNKLSSEDGNLKSPLEGQ